MKILTVNAIILIPSCLMLCLFWVIFVSIGHEVKSRLAQLVCDRGRRDSTSISLLSPFSNNIVSFRLLPCDYFKKKHKLCILILSESESKQERLEEKEKGKG